MEHRLRLDADREHVGDVVGCDELAARVRRRANRAALVLLAGSSGPVDRVANQPLPRRLLTTPGVEEVTEVGRHRLRRAWRPHPLQLDPRELVAVALADAAQCSRLALLEAVTALDRVDDLLGVL